MGGHGDAAALERGIHEGRRVHRDVGEVDSGRQLLGHPVDQKVAAIGVELGAFEDEQVVVVSELRVVLVEVELAMFGQDEAVDPVALAPDHARPLYELLHRSARVVGRSRVRMKVEEHRRDGMRARRRRQAGELRHSQGHRKGYRCFRCRATDTRRATAPGGARPTTRPRASIGSCGSSSFPFPTGLDRIKNLRVEARFGPVLESDPARSRGRPP